jgi:hypothetical protein
MKPVSIKYAFPTKLPQSTGISPRMLMVNTRTIETMLNTYMKYLESFAC